MSILFVGQTSVVRKACHLLLATAILWALPFFLSAVFSCFCFWERGVVENFSGYLHAAEKDKKKTRRKTPLIRAKTFKKLEQVQELAETDKLDEAINVLNSLKAKSKKLNSYEIAQMWNFYAFIYRVQEKYDNAIDSYHMVLKQPDLPVGLELQCIYTLAQIYHFIEKFDQAIKYYKKWFVATATPSADAYARLATVYYQVKQQDLAVENIKKAIAMYEEKNKVPKENWYSILLAVYHERGDSKNMETVLETLMAFYPKKSYWMQLAAVYDEQKRDMDYLSVLDAAYLSGYIDKEGYYLNIASSYRNYDVPFKAAAIIEDGIKKGDIKETSRNLHILSNSWQHAKEYKKAIQSLEKAARLSEDGELMTWLGKAYLDNEEFEQAAKALENGLTRGGVKRADKANIWLGRAFFNLDKFDKAEAAFSAARKDKRSATIASQWLKYISKERQRRQQLAKSGVH